MLGTDDPRAIIRTGESVYQAMGLGGADRDALLDAMVAHPILINRPLVETEKGVVLARPQDKVRDIL
jgi:arsenate reductase